MRTRKKPLEPLVGALVFAPQLSLGKIWPESDRGSVSASWSNLHQSILVGTVSSPSISKANFPNHDVNVRVRDVHRCSLPVQDHLHARLGSVLEDQDGRRHIGQVPPQQRRRDR